MSEIAIPEAAIRLAAEAIEEASILKVGHDLGTIHRDDIAEQGLRAAAPLIVAAELERLADEIGAAATLAHESAGENDTAALTAVANLSTAAKIRSRASVLRGEGATQ